MTVRVWRNGKYVEADCRLPYARLEYHTWVKVKRTKKCIFFKCSVCGKGRREYKPGLCAPGGKPL
jgi:hypothetical protein